MKKCKSCGTLTENSHNFCPNCASKEFSTPCPNCGYDFEGGKFCPNCGNKMTDEPQVQNTTDATNATQTADTNNTQSNQTTKPTQSAEQIKAAEPQPNPTPAKKQKKSSGFWGLLVVIVIAFFIGSLISDGFVSFFTSDSDKKPVTITLEEFEELEIGMSYDEVVEIVGGKGTLKNENGKGTDFHTQMYRFEGKEKRSYASLYFINGALRTKSQLGLDD